MKHNLTLSNGAVINIRGADGFTFNLGGDDVTGVKGTDKTFAEFVQEVLNSALPESGGEPVINKSVNIRINANGIISPLDSNDIPVDDIDGDGDGNGDEDDGDVIIGEVSDLTTKNGELVVGTDGDDTFNGVVSTSISEATLSSKDSIDGKGGNDTLNVTLKSSFGGFTDGGAVNVENIVLTNDSSISRSFSAEGIEGAESYTINSSEKELSGISNLEGSVDLTINGQAEGDFTTSFASRASEVNGTDDSMNLTLNSIGSEEESVNYYLRS